MNICLLVINYNGMKFLPLYLSSLQEQCIQNDIDLLVTDDLSTDGSADFLLLGSYGYTINQTTRHGFAANTNNGIRYAMMQKKFDYLIIANNDIVIQNGLFEALKKALYFLTKSDNYFGLLGVSEIFSDNKQQAETFNYLQYDVASIKQVNYIPGFFFVIKAALIDQVGYMDESYFMYGEDNDYFTRTQKGGYTIYNSGLPVIHFSEGSSADSKQTSWYVYRNAFLYAQKNLGFTGVVKMFFSFMNQIYNPFYKPQNPGNDRVRRNGFIYNNYLLARSILWNFKYYLTPDDRK